MKNLLFFLFLVSNLSFGQQAAYHLNGIFPSHYDYFLSHNNGIYYSNITVNNFDYPLTCSISYLPKNGQSGWKKNLVFSENFLPHKTAMATCNLSNDIIICIQSTYNDFCIVLKMTPNGNVIWGKILSYPSYWTDYGSNSNPLSINEQDEITITLTPVDRLFLSKLDTDGNLIFSKSIQSQNGGDGKNPGFSTISTPDGGYLITMKASNNPTIIKLDSELEVNWAKKWSIDYYSHPKVGAILPNGNYCIIGTGDSSTYIANVDPNGNLLSYKYNIDLCYPFAYNVINDDSIEFVDCRGFRLKMNLFNNSIENTHYENQIQISGLPIYANETMNFLDHSNSMIYLNLENDQMGCFDNTTFNNSLLELTVYPSSISNEQILIEDIGNISNYTPIFTITNDVSMTLTCLNSLELKETTKTNLLLYPNPAVKGQKVDLAMEKESGHTIQILSLSGKIMENAAIDKSVFNAPQEAGMYFVQLLDQAGNVIAVEKLIVE